MSDKVEHKAGVRYDQRTGQYFPQVDGVDASPTSFERERAMEIAEQLCRKALPNSGQSGAGKEKI